MLSKKKIMMIMLALCVAASSIGASFAPSPSKDCPFYYIAQGSESLKSIAKGFGMNWKTLASLNGIPPLAAWMIFPGQKLCVKVMGSDMKGAPIRILQVVRDTSVAIDASATRSRMQVDVLIGRFGAGATRSTKVATVWTGPGAPLRGTFSIPSGLRGLDKLEIWVKMVGGTTAASQWFYNMSSTSGGYREIPSVVVNSVIRNQSVTITAYNVAPNVVFEVLMASPNQKDKLILAAGTLSSATGGTVSASFNIPAGLLNKTPLVLLLRNTSLGYYAYALFQN